MSINSYLQSNIEVLSSPRVNFIINRNFKRMLIKTSRVNFIMHIMPIFTFIDNHFIHKFCFTNLKVISNHSFKNSLTFCFLINHGWRSNTDFISNQAILFCFITFDFASLENEFDDLFVR